jgi:hypothetical protein
MVFVLKSFCCNADIYYELWFCDKNPEGVCDVKEPHGNEIDGVTTCEDDYCRPDTAVVDDPTDEYLKTHECVQRCTECDSITTEKN